VKTRTLLVLAAGWFLVGTASLLADDDAKKELAALNGTWKAEALTQDGEEAPPNFLKQITFTIKDGKYTVTVDGKELESGTIKLDPGKKPKTIDFEIASGNDKGKTQIGIYELKDDTLKFAMSRPGKKERPAEMKSTKENETILSVLKREKK
jgi:uncharacterized protein (TIGR03067 family)